jgi:hypothetical protein
MQVEVAGTIAHCKLHIANFPQQIRNEVEVILNRLLTNE